MFLIKKRPSLPQNLMQSCNLLTAKHYRVLFLYFLFKASVWVPTDKETRQVAVQRLNRGTFLM